MPLVFYPHTEDAQKGELKDRIDILMEAAERYKATVLDMTVKPDLSASNSEEKKRMTPRDQSAAFNWEEIAIVLREIRESVESTKADKLKKAELLTKLAEVYEVLRGAKMSKLEAVRLALISELISCEAGFSSCLIILFYEFHKANRERARARIRARVFSVKKRRARIRARARSRLALWSSLVS